MHEPTKGQRPIFRENSAPYHNGHSWFTKMNGVQKEYSATKILSCRAMSAKQCPKRPTGIYLPFFIFAVFSLRFFTCFGILCFLFSRWASLVIFFLSWSRRKKETIETNSLSSQRGCCTLSESHCGRVRMIRARLMALRLQFHGPLQRFINNSTPHVHRAHFRKLFVPPFPHHFFAEVYFVCTWIGMQVPI